MKNNFSIAALSGPWVQCSFHKGCIRIYYMYSSEPNPIKKQNSKDQCIIRVTFGKLFFIKNAAFLGNASTIWDFKDPNCCFDRIPSPCDNTSTMTGNPILKFDKYCSGNLKNLKCYQRSSLKVLLLFPKKYSISGKYLSN